MESFQIYFQLILVCPLDYCSIETKATTKYTPKGEGGHRDSITTKRKGKKQHTLGLGNLSLCFSKHLQKQWKQCNQPDVHMTQFQRSAKFCQFCSLSAPNFVCVALDILKITGIMSFHPQILKDAWYRRFTNINTIPLSYLYIMGIPCYHQCVLC